MKAEADHARHRSQTIEAVAHDMTGSVVMAYDPAAVVDGAQVTVVTGSQFGFVSPTTSTATTSVPSTTSSSAGPPTTSSSTTTSTTSPFESSTAGDIGSPSPENTQLEPWDPRACAPGAVPTAPVPNPT